MNKISNLKNKIFNIHSINDFNEIAIQIFHYQYKNNSIYNEYVNRLYVNPDKIINFKQIPFLPIEFFKTHKIITGKRNPEIIFLSSGTTQSLRSKHYITDVGVYKKSFNKCFEYFYENVTDYCILAVLPFYVERKDSSLIYMVNDLIKNSNHKDSGFYKYLEVEKLAEKMKKLKERKQKIILIGLSYALLDIAEKHKFNISNAIIMETGGMKGKRKEIIRKELHNILCKSFGVESIHSEYGMTELLSQAYSKGNGLFHTPPWMKILIRDINDPITIIENEKTGGINVIDLANINSCSFIATQDLGRLHNDGSFEVIGRFDYSDVRGCNLMIE